MNLSTEQQMEFADVVTPAIAWLNNNCHPHTQIKIDCRSAELVESQLLHTDERFIKD